MNDGNRPKELEEIAQASYSAGYEEGRSEGIQQAITLGLLGLFVFGGIYLVGSSLISYAISFLFSFFFH